MDTVRNVIIFRKPVFSDEDQRNGRAGIFKNCVRRKCRRYRYGSDSAQHTGVEHIQNTADPADRIGICRQSRSEGKDTGSVIIHDHGISICAACIYAEIINSVMSVFMLNVFMLNVFMLDVFMLNVFMLDVFMLNVFMLDVFMLNVFMLDVFMLDVFMLDVFMLDVFMTIDRITGSHIRISEKERENIRDYP
jgi:hypothetical protein